VTPLKQGNVERGAAQWQGARGGSTHRRVALVSCPVCARILSLSGHTIQDDGKVLPSVVCPFSCGFQDFVSLEGWHGASG
jgi:hypothetical protein